MSKHTPNPWHIEDASYGQIVCHGNVDVAVVRNSDGLPHHANARLIAAAPDLLEALELTAFSAGFQNMSMETRELIISAIAKATS